MCIIAEYAVGAGPEELSALSTMIFSSEFVSPVICVDAEHRRKTVMMFLLLSNDKFAHRVLVIGGPIQMYILLVPIKEPLYSYTCMSGRILYSYMYHR